ncbi:MAG TPA: alpha-amylase family glycosyl hydrolase [Bryobacteraceae bacterium]|nr:alpha-amylase family glycosyl hydrolase [Bryobacteraceae bacterium]
MRNSASVFLASALLLAAAPAAELRFAGEKLDLRFNSEGRWTGVYDTAASQALMDSGDLLAPVVITFDGRTMVSTGRNHLWSIEDSETAGPRLALAGAAERSAGRFAFEAAEGEWRVRQEFAFRPDGTLERRARVTWTGERETLLRWVDLRTPLLSDLQGGTLEAPGYAGILHQPLSRLPMGRWNKLDYAPDADAPGWRPGLIAFRRGAVNLLVWPFSRDIPTFTSIERGERGIWLTHRFMVPCRLRKGQSVEIGSQFLRLERGSFDEALRRFQSFWDEAGVRLEGDTPAWARDARIYEVHLGRKSFNAGGVYEPYPAIGKLTDDLPRIASLGFNIVELMPRFPFPNYSVHDYLDIDTQYAPRAELARMIRRAHELDLKVFLDVTMHGVADKTTNRGAIFDKHPWLTAHPDWFDYTEDGRLARTYTWSFDHASPGFRDFIAQVFSSYVRDLDADGFRVDAVTWNFFPNWAQDLPRPGYRSIYGSVEMFEQVRRETRKIKPDVVFYTESTGPLFRTAFDLSYNYDERSLWAALIPVISKRGYAGGAEAPMSARDLAEWLDMRRTVLPRGLIRVHHADSHDSHEWGGLGQFRREAFGVDGARLLFAFSSFMDGGVMNYVGAEEGSEDFYRKVLSLRESLPPLQHGDCDYLALRPANDRVFAPLRRDGDMQAIPVLSFSTDPIRTELPLDALRLEPGASYEVREEFSGVSRTAKGSDLTRLPLDLPAYGVQLWTVRRAR